jgi:hypothetical protein
MGVPPCYPAQIPDICQLAGNHGIAGARTIQTSGWRLMMGRWKRYLTRHVMEIRYAPHNSSF